jgi:RsiW-degrading membrane proteinase PrsW (M82 family)
VADISFKVGAISLLGGLIPAFLWLWFWLREDDRKPEPRSLLILTFLIGMVSVFVVLPLEKLADTLVLDSQLLTIIWAGIEELIKYIAILFVALRSADADEPVDFAIYMITGALGFAAMENALFLVDPVALGDATVSLLTGNFRFLGAMLLHAVSSGLIGIALGLSFYQDWFQKKLFLAVGILGAITLHSVFNFLIINSDKGLFGVFSLLWGVSIIILLLFEQLRTMRKYV